jgi:hypothetical protein
MRLLAAATARSSSGGGGGLPGRSAASAPAVAGRKQRALLRLKSSPTTDA